MTALDLQVIGAAVIALAAAGVVVLRHARLLFVVEIVDGTARLRSGRAPGGFVSACTDVARLYGVRAGRIRGLRGPGGPRLAFSRDIPERARQPFRNVWTPPPPGGGPGGRRAAG